MAKSEYTRALSGFRGIDVASDDSNVDPSRFPFITNMWRDFKSENGAAVETFPGWRLVEWATGAGKINGLFGAKYFVSGKTEDFLIIHKGTAVYAAKHADRDLIKSAQKIGTCADRDTKGFQHNGTFYLLDGVTIYAITYSGEFNFKEIGQDPYIPTTYADGAEYEQRNMLTNRFYNRFNLSKLEEASLPDNGLTYAVLSEQDRTATVTGVLSGVKHVYIPSTCMIGGKEYTVRKVAEKAFQSSAIVSVVAASTVGDFGSDGATYGPFYNCEELEYAVLHGAHYLRGGVFAGCPKLTRLCLSKRLLSVATGALAAGSGMMYVYYGGTPSQATALKLSQANGGSSVVYTDVVFGDVTVGDTVSIPYTLSSGGYSSLINLRGNVGEGAYSAEQYTSDSGAAYAVTLEDKVAMLLLKVEGSDTFAVITSEKGGDVYHRSENPYAYYRFDILDPTATVAAVTLDGITPDYTLAKETLDGKTYIRAVILTAKRNSLDGKVLTVEGVAYESEFSRSDAGEDYRYGNGGYTGTSSEAIKKCTVWAEYDGRIFLTGNPNLPNTVFYSNRNKYGVNDPTYFGQLNYFNDGSGVIPNASLLATPSFLAVIKADTTGEGSIYYHTAEATEFDVLPKIYPSVQGSADIGSIGAAINFRDDPVFVSKDGLEGVALAGVNSERGLYHRSTNVDRMLLQACRHSQAELCVWEGYLCILADGKLFLADSRQMSTVNGGAQYEWYVIDDVGYYEGQRTLYYFPSASPYDSDGNKLTDLYLGGKKLEVKKKESFYREDPERDTPTIDKEGRVPSGETVTYVKETDEENEIHYYIVSTYGEQFEGVYSPCVKLAEISDSLYLGTESGRILTVNTDKRGIAVSDDEIPEDRIHPDYYTRCGRRYRSGCATKKDNCGVPQYDKDTVRRSLVIKAKTMPHGKFSIKYRTDREGWTFIQDATATEVNLYDFEFDNAALFELDENVQQLREVSRRWVEKQYFLYSDEFKRPFGLYSIAYRYVISGLTGRIRR